MSKLIELVQKLQYILKKLNDKTQKLRTSRLTQLKLQAEELHKEIQKEIEINNRKYGIEEIIQLKRTAKNAWEEICCKIENELINSSLESLAEETEIKEQKPQATFKTKGIKMTNFDIKLATGLVPIYDGSAELFSTFEDASKLLFELNEQHEEMLVKFLRTRLTGKARIGLPTSITTFKELLDDIKLRCEEKTNPDKVIAKLRAIKSGDTQKICNEVELLTAKLKVIYLEQGIPEKVANDMIVKKGIDTLKEKITNAETKTLLKAGTFTTITDVTQKVMENEGDETNKHVFNVRMPDKPYTRNNTYNNNTNHRYNKYKQNYAYHQKRVTNNYNDRNRYNSDNRPQQNYRANPQNTRNQNWRTNNNRRIYQTSVQAQGNNFLDQPMSSQINDIYLQ
ncbi:uncharacterized protein LOC125774273 [Anopheles funestus]|uniref:uncharacterized protein LOC125774273 n=1 Tax=Anopheles funestus TaxID=62324 RepID=UPI0020C707B9|nr:uncharacterized protein LOC125774273 [Anopheles funestus]